MVEEPTDMDEPSSKENTEDQPDATCTTPTVDVPPTCLDKPDAIGGRGHGVGTGG